MSAGGFMFSFPTFWRFHDHSGDPACDCCAKTPQQQTVVVKRRRVLSVSHGDGDGRSTVLGTPTSSPAASSETGAELESSHEPQQSPVDIREAESDVVEKQQSPIDIHEGDSDLVPMGSCVNAVTIAMGNGEAEIDYDGHGFHVVWSTAGNNTLTIGDKVFHAIQFHFHTPSEHTLDGVHEELELHLVHRAADGSFAVLGVLIREGKTNAFLSQFWDKLAGLEHDVPTKVPVGTINPKDLDLASSSFFRYRGSLTTPPYTEGVEWVVVHDVMEASREQLDAFHRALPGTNARDLQSLNHRHVMFAC